MTTTSVSDPLIGAVLGGRYEILQRLARGGMATVYRAADVRLSRTVAVKVMHEGLGDDSDFTAKFDREARAAARLCHPNVVSVFDQGHDHDRPYIVMEFVAGSTLRGLISREAPLDPLRCLELIEPVLSALVAAHDSGLVHRDIKPENVLISERGNLKVADFGLARAITSQSATATQGILIGTVSYLPPELVTIGRADTRSDVYSAGVVLFELLTGRKPHTGDSPIQVAYAHVHEDIPAPSDLLDTDWRTSRTGVPPYLDALVRAATQRDPDLRPTDAREFRELVRAARAALSAGIMNDPALTERFSRSYADRVPAIPAGSPILPEDRLDRVGEWPAAGAGFDGGSGFDGGARSAGPVGGSPHARPTGGALHASRRIPVAPPPRTATLTPVGASGRPHAAVRRNPAPTDRAATPDRAATLRRTPRTPGSPSGRESAVAIPIGPAVERFLRRGPLRTAPGRRPRAGATRHRWTTSIAHSPAAVRTTTRPTPVRRSGARRVTGPRAPRWVGLLLALLLTGAVLLGGWWLVEGRFVAAPAVVAQPQAVAARTAQDAGLGIEFTEAYSEDVPAGTVIASDPAAGADIGRGGTLQATVSLGPERFEAPRLSGLTREAATAALTERNLVPGRISEAYSTSTAPGNVMRTSAQPGALLPRGARVDLVLSRGPRPISITDQTGRSVRQAERALESVGFKVEVTTANSTDVAAGRVISQTPADGTSKRGDTIRLVRSLGPELAGVPELVGKPAGEATQLLQQAGFQVQTKPAAEGLGMGPVARVEPAAGSQAARGSTVTLYLG